MNIVAILQARVSSTRLPNKVLKTLLGKPMLQRQIERIKRSTYLNDIVVATSIEPEDDAIFELCNNLKVKCFRGSLDNVLDRYYQAAKTYNADHIVRLTGDCPLIDSQVIDQVIAMHLMHHTDYCCNCNPPTFPDGLDIEIFNRQALNLSWEKAQKPSEKEHVTQFIRNNDNLFKKENYQQSPNLSHLRWTVDENSDFDFVTQIYQYLYPQKADFSTQDILQLLKEKPELIKINSMFNRDEGLLKSLAEDKNKGY
jgi:spore coat polysaccharide biosynthesis protein SpsF